MLVVEVEELTQPRVGNDHDNTRWIIERSPRRGPRRGPRRSWSRPKSGGFGPIRPEGPVGAAANQHELPVDADLAPEEIDPIDGESACRRGFTR